MPTPQSQRREELKLQIALTRLRAFEALAQSQAEVQKAKEQLPEARHVAAPAGVLAGAIGGLTLWRFLFSKSAPKRKRSFLQRTIWKISLFFIIPYVKVQLAKRGAGFLSKRLSMPQITRLVDSIIPKK